MSYYDSLLYPYDGIPYQSMWNNRARIGSAILQAFTDTYTPFRSGTYLSKLWKRGSQQASRGFVASQYARPARIGFRFARRFMRYRYYNPTMGKKRFVSYKKKRFYGSRKKRYY